MSKTLAISSVPAAYRDFFRAVAEQYEYRRQADLFVEMVDLYVDQHDVDDLPQALRVIAEQHRRDAEEMETRVDEMRGEIRQHRETADELDERADDLDTAPGYAERIEVLAESMRDPRVTDEAVARTAQDYSRDPEQVVEDVRAEMDSQTDDFEIEI